MGRPLKRPECVVVGLKSEATLSSSSDSFCCWFRKTIHAVSVPSVKDCPQWNYRRIVQPIIVGTCVIAVSGAKSVVSGVRPGDAAKEYARRVGRLHPTPWDFSGVMICHIAAPQSRPSLSSVK